MHDRAWRPFLLALPALPLAAATWNVDTVAEIDAACSGAGAGDEIVIAAGTYVPPLRGLPGLRLAKHLPHVLAQWL